jgi:hypothetical protein
MNSTIKMKVKNFLTRCNHCLVTVLNFDVKFYLYKKLEGAHEFSLMLSLEYAPNLKASYHNDEYYNPPKAFYIIQI